MSRYVKDFPGHPSQSVAPRHRRLRYYQYFWRRIFFTIAPTPEDAAHDSKKGTNCSEWTVAAPGAALGDEPEMVVMSCADFFFYSGSAPEACGKNSARKVKEYLE